MARRPSRFVRMALALLTTAAVANGQAGADTARVVASRKEVRIVFPRDTARWGWTDEPMGWAYRWDLYTNAPTEWDELQFHVASNRDSARAFSSLRKLLAAGQLVRCHSRGMMGYCAGEDRGTASAEGGRVVLVLRDSALIAELFRLRPARVDLAYAGPEERQSWSDSVRVEYAAPDLAAPTDSLLASLAEQRRLDDKNSRRVARMIRIDESLSWGDTAWVVLGDTVSLSLDEVTCQGDLCLATPPNELRTDSTWVIGDSTVLSRVRRTPTRRVVQAPRAARGSFAVLEEVTIASPGPERRVAARLGAATVHVGGLPPYADSARVAQTPPRSVTRVVVVRPRVARVVIHPRPDTVYVGAEPLFGADVFDAVGGLLVHAHVNITYPDAGPRVPRRRYDPPTTNLPPGGPRRIVATYKGVADTVTVFVTDTTKR